MSVISTEAFAKIALNKSLCKEYVTTEHPRVVYLENGSEFQIQLFNSTYKPFAAKIFLDGEALSDQIVVRPGERIWLERYLNTPRKFKFSTYEIEDSSFTKELTKKNGEVKIEFYKEKEVSNYTLRASSYQPLHVYCNADCASSINSLAVNEITDISASSIIQNCDCEINSIGEISASCCDSLSIAAPKITAASAKTSIETGRIEKGGISNQDFSYIDMDFEYYPFRTETLFILPLSRKPYTASDLKKQYCTSCGRKLSPKHKFCPYCGTKVE